MRYWVKSETTERKHATIPYAVFVKFLRSLGYPEPSLGTLTVSQDGRGDLMVVWPVQVSNKGPTVVQVMADEDIEFYAGLAHMKEKAGEQ